MLRHILCMPHINFAHTFLNVKGSVGKIQELQKERRAERNILNILKLNHHTSPPSLLPPSLCFSAIEKY